MRKQFKEWNHLLVPDTTFTNIDNLGEFSFDEFIFSIKDAKIHNEYILNSILSDRDLNPDLNIQIGNKTFKKLWWTSDTHFCHNNIIKYSKRPYNNVKEMDEDLIMRWNHFVSDDDLVIHLGDISLGSAQDTLNILNRLNGNILFTKGNHDKAATDRICLQRFLRTKQGDVYVPYREYFKLDFMDNIYCPSLYNSKMKDNKRTIIMNHYPIASWESINYGTLQLFGHCHGTFDHKAKGKMLDVGVDGQISYFRPLGFNQIAIYMDNIELYSGYDD